MVAAGTTGMQPGFSLLAPGPNSGSRNGSERPIWLQSGSVGAKVPTCPLCQTLKGAGPKQSQVFPPQGQPTEAASSRLAFSHWKKEHSESTGPEGRRDREQERLSLSSEGRQLLLRGNIWVIKARPEGPGASSTSHLKDLGPAQQAKSWAWGQEPGPT